MLCHVSLVKESRLGVVFTTTILMAKYCTSFISLQCLLSEYYEMDLFLLYGPENWLV